MRSPPSWACGDFAQHGYDQVCSKCLENFSAQGNRTATWDRQSPRATFGRGWFAVGATHWFDGGDATVFPSRDGKRTLAQAFCGGICDVTISWAPLAGRECRKCLDTLRKANLLAPDPIQVDPIATTNATPESESQVRLYRGLKEPFDSTRSPRDLRSGTDFTNCPLAALSYAVGARGVLLVLDVSTTDIRIHEELWPDSKARRLMVWGPYEKYIVAQIPAKDLRAQLRRKGVAATSDEYKADLLRRYIEEYLAAD